MPLLLRRSERANAPLTFPTPAPSNVTATAVSSRQRTGHVSRDSMSTSLRLIVMGQNHVFAFLIIMYGLLIICRLGFGWSMGQSSVTYHLGGGTTTPSSTMVPVSHDNVTLVTAYFDVPSKRLSSEYRPWIRHTMSLQDNMIIFTTPDQAEWLKRLRGTSKKTYVVSMHLNETTLVRQYGMEFWEHQNKVEPGTEKFLHSKELYIIWNQKSHFLQQAIDINPFDSSFLAWTDIGYLRDDLLDEKRLVRYLPRILKENQVLLLDVRKLVGLDYLGGGFIGGYRKGIRRWKDAYYKVLDTNKDRFIGKDQPWMFRTCMMHPDLCVMVEAKNTYGDPWFHMAPYLHGVQFYGMVDHLRRVWERSMLHKLILWTEQSEEDEYDSIPGLRPGGS